MAPRFCRPGTGIVDINLRCSQEQGLRMHEYTRSVQARVQLGRTDVSVTPLCCQDSFPQLQVCPFPHCSHLCGELARLVARTVTLLLFEPWACAVRPGPSRSSNHKRQRPDEHCPFSLVLASSSRVIATYIPPPTYFPCTPFEKTAIPLPWAVLVFLRRSCGN